MTGRSSRSAGPLARALLTGRGWAAPPPATPAANHSGDIETRLRRVEDELAKSAEALAFLRKVYAQQAAQAAEQAASEPDPEARFAVAIANDVAVGKVDGPATAAVTIIKAFDFACPYCQRTAATMDELVAAYPGKVRVVFKDYVVHPDVAMDAHLAACAAAKQGKYKAYKQLVWDKGFLAYAESRDPSKLAKANLLVLAQTAGLDGKRLQADMASPACKELVAADMAELEKFHVDGTPAFFVNGKMIKGALPTAAFKEIVDEELAAVTASGVPAADYYDKVVLAKGEKAFRAAGAR